MTIRENLDLIDDILDAAWTVPLSGGRCVVDIEKIREALDDIRLNMPSELKQARTIVDDRKIIIDDARKEAESKLKIAEERAKKLVDTSEIVKQSQQRAKEILSQANTQSREIKRAANEYVENILKNAEELLINSLQEIKTTRQAVRKPAVAPAVPSPEIKSPETKHDVRDSEHTEKTK